MSCCHLVGHSQGPIGVDVDLVARLCRLDGEKVGWMINAAQDGKGWRGSRQVADTMSAGLH